jgi:hypothetical protein
LTPARRVDEPALHALVLGAVLGPLVALSALLCAAPALYASVMVPPAPYAAKDFSLVKRNGQYHLFFIRRDTSLPIAQTEKDFGHAVSYDLHNWQQLPPVLAVNSSTWDNSHVWAPGVIEYEGLYYMFYAGVSEWPGVFNQFQRIGVATSSDMLQWNRADAPVFDCTTVPSVACDPLIPAYGFRDPHVLADPTDPGQFWLYFAAQSSSNPSSMVIGTAGTDRLPTGWTDNGPLWVTSTTVTGSDLAESPHILEHAGRWFLMWTTNGVQPIVYAIAPSPVASTPSWAYKGPLANMLGFDTSPWFASEHMRDGKVDYFAAASAGGIEILKLDWQTDSTFQVSQPDLMHVVDMWWSDPVVPEGDPVNLHLAVTNPSGMAVAIEAHEIDVNGNETLIPNAQIGLPATIPLIADTTVYRWQAQRWPDGDDLDATDAEIRIRLVDCTAEAGPIRVLPPMSPPSEGGPGAQRREIVGEGFVLSFLARSPLGPAFHVELPEAASVRLDVIDIQGRRVRSLAERTLPAGASVVQWDGRDARGTRLAPGIYFATLRAGHIQRSVRIAVLP